MESNELYPKKLANISVIMKDDTKYIPIKTLKNYIFSNVITNFTFYDCNSDEKIDYCYNGYWYNLFINSINKFFINNINYLLISASKKERFSLKIAENALYIIKGKELKKEENSLSKCLEEEIQKIIILDNKDVVALRNRKLISYYLYNNSNYKKFFNNLNKGDYIFGLIKLSKNNFCYLSSNDEETPSSPSNNGETSKNTGKDKIDTNATKMTTKADAIKRAIIGRIIKKRRKIDLERNKIKASNKVL